MRRLFRVRDAACDHASRRRLPGLLRASSGRGGRDLSNVAVRTQEEALWLDPRGRREALFRVHSTLRSADRLRPDEAFDQLVSLYEVWVDHGPLTPEEITTLRTRVALSATAIESAVPALWRVLGDRTGAVGADLFQELVDVGIRSGLGQYFTPRPVAEAMAAFLKPRPDEVWLDPFCGSGLLLGQLAQIAPGPLSLFGIDVDRRVLHLAGIEAKLRHPGSKLSVTHVSALDAPAAVLEALGAPATGVDGIVTNPPFGAVDLRGDGIRHSFELARKGPTEIEILGLEQSIRLLREGGRMGIVLPQSVFSNKRSEYVRTFLRERVRVTGVLGLPPETFSMFKGVGKSSVLFLTKGAGTSAGDVWFGLSTCIGWDGTGREIGPADVTDVAIAMRQQRARDDTVGNRVDADVSRNMSAEWNLRRDATGVRLADLVETIFTGRTAPRSAYCEPYDGGSVCRTIKVGNLTGAGINWAPGDRGFAVFKHVSSEVLLRGNDVALTAAAHHPRYIGAKVDIVDTLPEGWADRCLPSGELLIIRPSRAGIDPRVLLMWLRSDQGRTAIQACITGQTAHLHPEYVLDVVVPDAVLSADASRASEILMSALASRREAERLEAEARAVFGRVVNPVS